MIFKVPDSFKGTFVLNTLNKALWAGNTVSIVGDNLYASDVKSAIKKGVLVSVDNEYTQKEDNIGPDVIITNKTNKLLVLGDIVLKGNQALFVDRNLINSSVVKIAEKNKLITISTTKTEFLKEETTKEEEIVLEEEKIEEVDLEKELAEEIEENTLEEDDSKDNNPTLEDELEENSLEDKLEEDPTLEDEIDLPPTPKSGEDIKVEPVIWNFREQKNEKAQFVPKSDDIFEIEEPIEKKEEVDFIDKKEDKKPTQKRTYTKKATKVENEKEENKTKTRKNKVITAVGEVHPEKTLEDAILELDSMGNPIVEKPSDTLQSLINSLDGPSQLPTF